MRSRKKKNVSFRENNEREGGETRRKRGKASLEEEDPPPPPPKKTSKTSTLSLAHQLLVMFSWLTTRILLFGSACSRCLARSMQTSELEQPMPAIE